MKRANPFDRANVAGGEFIVEIIGELGIYKNRGGAYADGINRLTKAIFTRRGLGKILKRRSKHV